MSKKDEIASIKNSLGLGSFVRAGAVRREEKVTELALADIVPNAEQPRKKFDPGKLEELAASIREQGVLQPIVVRPVGNGKYQLVAGERRYRASLMAGKTEIPVVVKDLTDDEAYEAMAVENLQRQDLTGLEEIDFVAKLAERSHSNMRDLATKLGKGRDWVNRRLMIARDPGMYARAQAGESIDAIIRNHRQPSPTSNLVRDSDKTNEMPYSPKEAVDLVRDSDKTNKGIQIDENSYVPIEIENFLRESGKPKLTAYGEPVMGVMTFGKSGYLFREADGVKRQLATWREHAKQGDSERRAALGAAIAVYREAKKLVELLDTENETRI